MQWVRAVRHDKIMNWLSLHLVKGQFTYVGWLLRSLKNKRKSRSEVTQWIKDMEKICYSFTVQLPLGVVQKQYSRDRSTVEADPLEIAKFTINSIVFPTYTTNVWAKWYVLFTERTSRKEQRAITLSRQLRQARGNFSRNHSYRSHKNGNFCCTWHELVIEVLFNW